MSHKIVLALFIVLFLSVSKGTAQSSRDSESIVVPQKPQYVNKRKKPKKNSLSYKLDHSVEEYHKLMKKNKKKYAKREKGMKKPQYSDHTYFGHKKQPKKRAIGKRKMCKECGIVH